MNILHVYKDYYPPVKGGIESHINLLTNGLRDRGVNVQVLVSNTTNKFETDVINGIPVFKAPQYGRFYSAPLTPSFHCFLRRFGKQADILHFHHPNPTAELAYFFTNLGKKLIVTYHSDIIRQDKLGKLYSPFRKVFLEKSDRIIATSPNYIQSSGVLKQFRRKCSVIPLGTDIERFRSYDDFSRIEKVKHEYGNKPIVLFVGCFRYYKGLHLLLSAMKGVDCNLVLIGTGPEEAKLRRFAENNGLNEKVFFEGELPDDEVNAYYNACDIFVLPSHLRSEAFGMVQLEAMCCKKPVVSTQLQTGTSFVNIHQQTGLIVSPNDAKSLTQAINYLIDNPEKRNDFGRSGYARVRQLFSADKMVDDTLKLYQQIINPTQSEFLKKKDRKRGSGLNDNRIRILRIVSRLNIGGPSIHIKNLTEGLDSSKYITKLVTGSISPNEGDMSYITHFGKDVRVIIPELQREIKPIKDLLALVKVIKIILAFKPDIVHSHTSKAGTISRVASLLCNVLFKTEIIVVHTFHGNVLDGYFNRVKSYLILLIERIAAKFTDRIIAISDSQKWELTNLYKIGRPHKIEMIKLGFDLSPFLNCQRLKGVLRKRIGLPDATLLIGIVGRMAPIKNHKMFLNAGKLLIENLHPNKIRFILVGDGEERLFLKNYVDEIGLAKYVIFHGWEKNIPMIYGDIDILALTSLNEGTPVSVIEAMAASVPVVTTGVGGIKDLLGRFGTKHPAETNFNICQRGILCPKDDPIAFSNALIYMAEGVYLSEKDRFAQARDYVLENYSIGRLIVDVESLYKNLIRARKNH